MSRLLSFVVFIICWAAILFALLAAALPNWYVTDGKHHGLWQACIKISGTSLCLKTNNVFYEHVSSFRATQAMVLLGLLSQIAALVFITLALFVLKGRSTLGYVAGALSLAAGFFLMIGMAIFVSSIYGGPDFGPGLAMVVLGWFAAWATGFLMLFITWRGSKPSSSSGDAPVSSVASVA